MTGRRLVDMLTDPNGIEEIRRLADELGGALLSHLAHEENELLGPLGRSSIAVWHTAGCLPLILQEHHEIGVPRDDATRRKQMMDRMNALAVAANLAEYSHLLCRLEGAGSSWTARILSVNGDHLYTIETNEEANFYISELWDDEEEE